MSDVEIRLERIEKTVNQILEIVSVNQDKGDNKWLSEHETMQMLNVSKRGLDAIRKKKLIKASSATGRNFLFLKRDVEKYISDHSVTKKGTKNNGNKTGNNLE